MNSAWPRKGLCAFLGFDLHPSSALLAWLASVLAVQFLGYAGLGVLALGLLLSSFSMLSLWFTYLRRARWLFLSLWLILAYNTPGEAFQDMPWAPTYEGMADANLQVVRLILMLGCLAWLFQTLGRDGLVAALWGVVRVMPAPGFDAQRLVVRLSLVLNNLQTPQQKGDWKKMLAGDADFVGGPSTIHFSLPAWRRGDTFWAGAAVLGLIGAVVL